MGSTYKANKNTNNVDIANIAREREGPRAKVL